MRGLENGRWWRRGVAAAAGALLATAVAAEPAAQGADEGSPFAHLAIRNVGPVNMSGRVADVEGELGNPDVVWVGSASGGVWKSSDGGVTFAPVFDDQPVASIGDIALAPSNPEVVYVGTGESAVRNSVSFGDGVYRTTDGGKSWSHLGLDDTRHISRIVVDPHDPDTAWVGALGHIYGLNEERGVFRTTDGGKHWEKVLYLDDRHGVADLELVPSNPKVLYAALWRFERKPWTFTSGDEKGGVWRSVDGGDSWERLTEGLPEVMGRIGVRVAPSHPDTVYVIAESDEGTVFRSDDGGDTFRKVSEQVDLVSRGFYYTKVRVDPRDENTVYAVASQLFRSVDGGKTFERISRSTHIDFHALWIDPLDPSRLWQGQDGGVAVTYDGGATWEPVRNLPIGQFYQVFADGSVPFYRVGGGLQDNGTWIGPSQTRERAGILPDDWRMFSFGDAYWVVPDPDDPDVFVSEYQAGGILRTDLRTRTQVDISPQPRRNDGGPVGELEYRFNWNAPIVASPHDPSTIYFGGNVVFRTTDFGDHWTVISPDLTTDEAAKQGTAGGPVWRENTTAEYHTTIISLAESPARSGVLWAGTDDGNLQLSTNGGGDWSNVVGHVRGLPDHSAVSHVEPARDDPATAWAAFDRHQLDDFRPYLYLTRDLGASWKRLDTAGIPDRGWIWVVRQDPKNPDLLYAGTELGLYASWQRGDGGWRRLDFDGFPTVAVHDLIFPPGKNDLVVGTHGRAIWILDDLAPIQQLAPLSAGARLYPVRPALRHAVSFSRYGLGDKVLVAPNPPYGALVTYQLAEKIEVPEEGADGKGEQENGDAVGGEGAGVAPEKTSGELEDRIEVEVLDDDGQVIRTLEQPGTEKGLNRVAWDLCLDPPTIRKEDEEASEFFGPPRGPMVLPGRYTVRLTLDGAVQEQEVRVDLDPEIDVTSEALEAQYAAARRLWRMRDAANRALKALDSVAAQLAERRQTLKDVDRQLPAELEKAWKELDDEVERLTGTLARPENRPTYAESPRLEEQIADLFSNVEAAYAAPTEPQRRYQEVLERDLDGALGQVEQLLTEILPAFDAQLDAEGLPGVLVPEEVSVKE